MLPAGVFESLQLPVIGAPLFIISGPDLVIAQCKAGIVGSFPALNARPQPLLDEWLHRVTEELAAWDKVHPERPAAPFAVNQIVHKSNSRLRRWSRSGQPSKGRLQNHELRGTDDGR